MSDMTVREAGSRGGHATAAKYGTEHYQELGRLGAAKLRTLYGTEHYQEMGKKGAAAAIAAGHDLTAAGLKGGQSTKQRMLAKDPNYYRTIAAKSWETRRERAKETGKPLTGTNGGKRKDGTPIVRHKDAHGRFTAQPDNYYPGAPIQRPPSPPPVPNPVPAPRPITPRPQLTPDERAKLDAQWARLTRKDTE